MQNITVLLALRTGTTAAASSEVQPMTSARPFVLAIRLPTAGTASAGSPLVSAEVQASLWPSTPPALLMACTAPSQETRYVGPSAASAPLNGATSATVSVEPDAAAELPELLGLLLLLLLQAASAAVSAIATASEQALNHRP